MLKLLPNFIIFETVGMSKHNLLIFQIILYFPATKASLVGNDPFTNITTCLLWTFPSSLSRNEVDIPYSSCPSLHAVLPGPSPFIPASSILSAASCLLSSLLAASSRFFCPLFSPSSCIPSYANSSTSVPSSANSSKTSILPKSQLMAKIMGSVGLQSFLQTSANFLLKEHVKCLEQNPKLCEVHPRSVFRTRDGHRFCYERWCSLEFDDYIVTCEMTRLDCVSPFLQWPTRLSYCATSLAWSAFARSPDV